MPDQTPATAPKDFVPFCDDKPAGDIMRFFRFEHLPEGKLRETSKAFCDFAIDVIHRLPGASAERTVCLRKLLEAKDCAVRAYL